MKRGLIIMLSLVMFGFMSCDNGSSSTSSTNNDWGEWSAWSEWVVTTPTTTTVEGVETRTRTRTCNNTAQVQTENQTRPIPVLVPVVTMSITVTGHPTIEHVENVSLNFSVQDQYTAEHIIDETATWPEGVPLDSGEVTFNFYNVTAEHLERYFTLILRNGSTMRFLNFLGITLTLGSNTIPFSYFQ